MSPRTEPMGVTAALLDPDDSGSWSTTPVESDPKAARRAAAPRRFSTLVFWKVEPTSWRLS